MEDLINLLEEFFRKDTRYHNKEEIKRILKLKGESEAKILLDALQEMEETGKIFFDKKNGYRAFPSTSGFAFGEIEINKSGTGFVHTNDGYTILIENNDLKGALQGDNVIVANIYNKRKDYYHGEIYKIAKRKTGNVVMEVVGNGTNASLFPYNLNDNINIAVDRNKLKNVIDGDLILVNVGCNPSFGVFEGEIVKIIGHKDDPTTDIKLIFDKYDIPIEFSKDVIDEAKKIPNEVKEDELINRKDLRNENIFTIDCDTTKDRDDAVGIKKLDNGNYLLKVSIAHVSNYIKEGSKLYDEALNRCFSHYLGNTCNPMFPHILSNGICSLNENVDRLTRTVEMEINKKGEIVNYDIYSSVINSKKAMSYSSVNKVLKNEFVEGYNPFIKDLKLMEELNDILENAREKRNYLNFDTKETTAIENHDEVLGFKVNDLGKAGQIIENFMLVANTTIYNHFSWFTLAYRVHESPNEERVREVLDLLKTSGIKIPKIQNINIRSLKTIINDLTDSDINEIARECLLKSMKKAKYDTNNIGHFALQYDTYGHFTSPIRRVIDLLTHTIIDNIEEGNVSEEYFDKFDKLLKDICNRSNEIEKIDNLMEEEALDMLMAKYMEDKIGEEFNVIVTDISKNGMLVKTDTLIRGKIKLENMEDDKYYYDYDKKAIIGKKSKKKYQIGSKEYVLLKDASKATRTVNFEISKEKILKKGC